MHVKSVIPRGRAMGDVDDALDHYRREAGEATALAFVDALEKAFDHLSRYPASGSLRYAHELELPELRFWPLKRFPFLICYLDRPDHIDVWRILLCERDIPSWLHEPVPPE